MLRNILVILLFSVNSVANADMKIAIVDVEKIVENSTATMQLKEKAEQKKAQLKAKMQDIEEGLKKDKEKLEKQKAILSKEAFEKKFNKFRKDLIDANNKVKAEGKKLEEVFMSALKKIDNVTMSIVSDIAKKRKYNIVLPKSKILFYRGNDDITDEVLSILNKKLKKVEFK